jgi:hypothetical protein
MISQVENTQPHGRSPSTYGTRPGTVRTWRHSPELQDNLATVRRFRLADGVQEVYVPFALAEHGEPIDDPILGRLLIEETAIVKGFRVADVTENDAGWLLRLVPGPPNGDAALVAT